MEISATDTITYEVKPFSTETYGTPVLATPIATVFRNGRWQWESKPRLGFLSGFSADAEGNFYAVTVQFEVGGCHHSRKVTEVMVVDEDLAQEDLDAALAVATAAASDLAKRSGWASLSDVVRRRLRSEADEAAAAAIYWAQEGGRLIPEEPTPF